ncbi:MULTISPECIES: hypothetical protein [unclassified Microcoleus]|uniref:hypothetical protein n=1 Tax=unclassified Microcoleus TaxID=2642155 RepID=UPI0025D1242C|nr:MULTISPECIES: hypothetical protein [unclassified Microcoleus]
MRSIGSIQEVIYVLTDVAIALNSPQSAINRIRQLKTRFIRRFAIAINRVSEAEFVELYLKISL